MANYDQFEASVLTEGMTSEQKLRFHREMSDAWRDPKQAARLKFWLGGIGAHHFYLGNQSKGMAFLLLCWTGVPVIISLFEGNVNRRVQRVNSDLAMQIAARIKGVGAFPIAASYAQYPPTAPAYQQAPQAGATPVYPPTQSPQAPSYPPLSNVSAPPAQPSHSPVYAAASTYAPPTVSGKSNTKRWVLAGVAGLVALVVVAGLVGRVASQAKESSATRDPKSGSDPKGKETILHPVGTSTTPSSLIGIYKMTGTRKVLDNGRTENQSRTGKLDVTQVSESKFRFVLSVALVVDESSGNVSTGDLDGDVEVRNGEAAFSYDRGENDKCKLEMKFAADKIELSQEHECGFGLGVLATGMYIKSTVVSSQPSVAPSKAGSCLSAGSSEERLLCSTEEFQREDLRLNVEYKRVMAAYKAQGQDDSVAALRKTELAWLKSMTTKCDSIMNAPDASQRMRSQAINECRLDLTKSRADELAKLP